MLAAQLVLLQRIFKSCSSQKAKSGPHDAHITGLSFFARQCAGTSSCTLTMRLIQPATSEGLTYVVVKSQSIIHAVRRELKASCSLY